MELKRVKIKAHDEPEFAQIGPGDRRLIMWRGADERVNLLYQPNMALVRMAPERFDAFKPKEEKLDPKPTANAIAERKARLGRMNLWDGGKVVDKIIEALNGAEISVAEVDALYDTDQPAGNVLTPADLDKEAKGAEAAPPKAKRSKKGAEEVKPPAEEEVYQPALKDRVRRKSDKDDPQELGTIIGVGPEQSAVKWDDSKEGFELNKWLVKVQDQPKAKEVEPMATKAAKKSTAKKGGTKKAAEKKSARAESNDPIVREFQVAEGSNRHKAFKLLRGSLNKKVKLTDLSKAVYGNKDSVGKLGGVVNGCRAVIEAGKLGYTLSKVEGRGEEATVTMNKK